MGRFLDFVGKELGDETKAWELFRSSPPGPDEIRSRNRVLGEKAEKRRAAKGGGASASGGGDGGDYGILGYGSGGKGIAYGQGQGQGQGGKGRSGSVGSGSGMMRPWRLPLISSPGLCVVPPPSILQRLQKQEEKEEEEDDDDDDETDSEDDDDETDRHDRHTRHGGHKHDGPKIEMNEQGYITPSLLFDHALHAAGFTTEKLAEAKHRASSIVRTVDDMFDSNVAIDGIELVPLDVWNDNHSGESDSGGDSDDDDEGGTSEPVHQKRLTKESLMDGLRQMLEDQTQPSHHPYQFEDMIPKSLTTSLPESFVNQKKDYLRLVQERDEVLEIYHYQKEANEDAMDAHEDAMDEWRKRKEQYERRKARRAAKAAAKQKEEEEARRAAKAAATAKKKAEEEGFPTDQFLVNGMDAANKAKDGVALSRAGAGADARGIPLGPEMMAKIALDDDWKNWFLTTQSTTVAANKVIPAPNSDTMNQIAFLVQQEPVFAAQLHQHLLKHHGNGNEGIEPQNTKDGPACAGAASTGLPPGMAGQFGLEMMAKIAVHPKLKGYMSDPAFMVQLNTLQTDPNQLGSMLGNPRIMEVCQFVLGQQGVMQMNMDTESSSSSSRNQKKNEPQECELKKDEPREDEPKKKDPDDGEKKTENGSGENGTSGDAPTPNTEKNEKKDEPQKDELKKDEPKKKELEGPGPEPIPPTLPALIEVPSVPIPPSLASHLPKSKDTEGQDDSPKKTNSIESSCITEQRRHLVVHLDPSSFSKNGRYYGLFSNDIADPQFVGPHAPGIAGLNSISGTGLATTYSGPIAAAERLSRSGSIDTPFNEDISKKSNSSISPDKRPSSSSKSPSKSSASKPKKARVGPAPTNTATQLKKMMETGGPIADTMRDSIVKAAVYASRTGIHSGSFIGSTGETYPDISKAFSNHAKCRPCTRCKNNKQGAYHCRLKRKHTDADHDGGSSYKMLTPLFDVTLKELMPSSTTKKP